MLELPPKQQLGNLRRLIPLGSTWRHRRGETYFVVGHCMLSDHSALAVLSRGEDGVVWCRPTEHFFDGRLTCIDLAVRSA